MLPKLVSIIIATHNNKDCLKDCLNAVRRQGYKPIEVIVILNDCNDTSVRLLETEFPGVRTIINKENLFFACAQNQGIEIARGEFILCLNDDCVLDENFISEAVRPFSFDENIGMVSGKILRRDSLTIDSTGLFLGRSRRPIERGFNQRDTGRFQKAEYIYGVSGAAGFYRRRMLDEVKDAFGYFDSRFRMFYEDLDLCWRANIKGWRGYYIPQAIAYHKRGGSVSPGKTGGPFPGTFYFVRLPLSLQLDLIKNRHLTMIKNDSLKGVFLNLPFTLAYELKLWAYLVIFRSPQLLKFFLKKP